MFFFSFKHRKILGRTFDFTLSLIDNQDAFQERELIENISQNLDSSCDESVKLYITVAEFFLFMENVSEFLKNNTAAKQFQDYMNDKAFLLVKKCGEYYEGN